MTAFLTEIRDQNIFTTLTKIKTDRSVRFLTLLRLAGTLAAAMPEDPLRPFQRWLIGRHLSAKTQKYTLVKVTYAVWQSLKPWCSRGFLMQGVAMGPLPARREVVTTDASQQGWGGVWKQMGVRGTWGKKIQFQHINYLELKAVFLTLTHFSSQLIHKHVLIRSDNVSVVFNINHQGSTRSLKLLQAARELWVWADTHLSSLRAIQISGHMNKLAGALSRSVPRAGEWQLHPEIVQLIWNTYGAADVDLFARIQSAQCPRWFSLCKEVGSLGLDTMAHSWPSGLLYVFPPFPMIWLVLSRIRVTSQPLLLIAPCWPNKPWFQLLCHLLTGTIN